MVEETRRHHIYKKFVDLSGLGMKPHDFQDQGNTVLTLS